MDLSSQFDKERNYEKSLKHIYILHAFFTIFMIVFLPQTIQNIS